MPQFKWLKLSFSYSLGGWILSGEGGSPQICAAHICPPGYQILQIPSVEKVTKIYPKIYAMNFPMASSEKVP